MEARFDTEQALDDAIALHLAGDAGGAEAGYRRVLHAEPDHPDALNCLGLLLQDAGQYAESQSLLERAVGQIPDFAEALTNLARVQQITGQPAAAAASATLAIASDPELQQAHLLLGRSLLDLKDHTGAETALRTAIRLQPSDIDAHIFLGTCACALRRREEARDAFNAAMRLDQGTMDTAVRVAGAWMGHARFDEAEAVYLTIIAKQPGSATARAGLAGVYHSQNRPEESLEACRLALDLEPGMTDVRLLLGKNLAYLGRFDDAEAAIRDVLAREPASIRAQRDLAAIGRLVAASEDAGRLRAILADETAPAPDRAAAGFALGSALDKAGAHNQAFEAFALANQLVHRDRESMGRGFQPAAPGATVDWLRATFNPDLFARLADFGDRSDDLVFIVGMPRSGTSLVEQIAASHPDVFGAGERLFIGTMIERLNRGLNKQSPETWERDEAMQEARACLGRYRALAGGRKLIIDKLPDNVFFLGQIAVLFPRARIIFCDRDARDICLSAYFQHFGSEMAWCYDLADCAVQAQETARLTEHWRQALPLRMLDVRYETLVSDLEGQSRRLIDFLGLDWDPACLEFHETDRPILTASMAQVRQPLYASSVGRWKHYRWHITGLIFGLFGLVPAPEPEDWDHLLTDPERALSVAMVHHGAGRPDPAKQIYDAVLVREPRNPKAHHLLGIWYLNSGKPADSLACLKAARDIQPDNGKLTADLAQTYLALKDYNAAMAWARLATEQYPGLSEGWCHLGHAMMCLSDLPGASAAMERALELAPESRGALIGSAAVLAEQQRFQESEVLWRKAGSLYPYDESILEGLAKTLAEQRLFEEGLLVCQQAIRLNPGSSKLQLLLASIHMRAQNLELVLATLEPLLRTDETLVDGWVMYAFAQAMNGKHDDAARHYMTALSIDPDNAEALTGLITIAKAEASPNALSAVARLQADATAKMTERAAAAMTIANACDKRGDYDAAFAAFANANALLRASRPGFEPGKSGRELGSAVDFNLACFTRLSVAGMARFGIDSDVPAFVVGLPRSGTSLVEQIAASHPSVLGLGERGDFLNGFAPESRAMLLGLMDYWDTTTLRSATTEVVRRLREEGPDYSRIINKLPGNIRWLGHIAALLPNAKIIVCRRDLRDILWSCYTHQFFDHGMAWTDTLEECAEYARETERLMDHWHQVLPGRFHEVFYEDMVEDLEGEARRLIDYLGLPWDPACLSFHKTERAVMTASHWQVRQPLYATSVGRWRPYRKHLGPLLDGLKGLIPDHD